MTKKWDLRERTMDFAVDVFKFCRALPRTEEARDIVRQLRRAASSVASNCRAARRAQSDRVFVSKTAIVIEEADEAGFWLEFLIEVEIAPRAAVQVLLRESSELVAIFTSSRKKATARLNTSLAGKRAAQQRQ
jgi:four helix bundle protein